MGPSLFTRFCARLADYGLIYGMGVLASLILPIEASSSFYLWYAVAVPLLGIPIEALFLSSWGTTPGKFLFNLSIRDRAGQKLGLRDAFKRASGLTRETPVLQHKKTSFFRQVIAVAASFTLLGLCILSKNISDYTIGTQGYYQMKMGWVHYFSKEAGFHVNFPSDPQVEAKEVSLPRTSDPVSYNQYTSHQNAQVYYTVSYIDLPKKWSFVSSKRILQGVLEVVLKMEEDKALMNKEYVDHKQYSAIEYRLCKDGVETLERLIRVGNRLFKISAVFPPSVAGQPQHREFIESFELGGPMQEVSQTTPE